MLKKQNNRCSNCGFLFQPSDLKDDWEDHFEYEPDSIDKKALERILTNLIDNAFKYSEENSTISINIKTKIKDENIIISVSDTGRGISDEDKLLIFDRFFRTADARASEKKGSGLGLAIVKNLVNSLNGDVGVKNAPNKGSEFWFTLPLGK